MSDNTKFVQKASFALHRAKGDGNGAASRFSVSTSGDRDPCVFLEIAAQGEANQNGDATFQWRRWDKENKKMIPNDNSITVKLNNSDIGELLAVISGRKEAAGGDNKLFHKSDTKETVIDFSFFEKGKCFMLNVSTKDTGAKVAPRKIGHSVSFGESEVLRVFLEKSLAAMNSW